jgi:hypothetical protein
MSAATFALAVQLAASAPETVPAAGRLESVVRSTVTAASSPTWIGWTVPTDRARDMGRGTDERCCTGCALEGESAAATIGGADAVRLEPPLEMRVMLRAETGVVTDIRTFSVDCRLDAGTARWIAIDGASPAESVRVLSGFVVDKGDERKAHRLSDRALAAIAFHADAGVVDVLARYAREGASGHLRGKALFWLSQRAGEKAAQTIARAVEEDPELEVKKKAVFALGQLPRDEGVPLLIRVARTSRDPKVQKQAFFWLGQSRDPRALAFFEAVLK